MAKILYNNKTTITQNNNAHHHNKIITNKFSLLKNSNFSISLQEEDKKSPWWSPQLASYKAPAQGPSCAKTQIFIEGYELTHLLKNLSKDKRHLTITLS